MGASLLFVVQPMVARLVLPQFGGSATVWSTSSLFFQVVLLIGYIYAHISTQKLGPRLQPLLHVGLVLLPLMVLPVALAGGGPPTDASPILRLLWILALTIGLPFAVVSTTGPLLQRWYSWTVGHRAEDPYFLFATSNLGSFVGLLAYPFVVEPLLTLDQQRLGWSFGYGVFMVLMIGSGAVALVNRSPHLPIRAQKELAVASARERIPARQVLIWLALAFIPSSLMLGVTAHISTDVAAVPLLWVVPLSIYLATFVVAFARSSRHVSPRWQVASAAAAVVALLAWFPSGGLPIWLLIVLNLAVLAVASSTAHAMLASRRPPTAHLTFYYIVVAVGGALGGLLNGVVAPLLFNAVWEYPLILVATIVLALPQTRPSLGVLSRRYHPAFVRFLEVGGTLAILLVLSVGGARSIGWQPWLVSVVPVGWIAAGVLFSRRPLATMVAALVFLLIPSLTGGEILVRDRSFYGAYTVRERDGWRLFSHGTTLHGQQALGERRSEPSTYYARGGPVGDAYSVLEGASDIAAVGLGVGTLAAYGEPDQRLTFFEIDPDVIEVASNPDLFTFLSESLAAVDFVVGDGRLRIEEQRDASYDMVVLDAFTSDAIPVHLLTQDAFESYGRVLKEDGLLLVHVSSRVFDLEPVVAAGADTLGWEAVLGRGELDDETGATLSEWVALSADGAKLDSLLADDKWRSIDDRRVVWTDNFSSIVTVLRRG
ncbi:spermidine synthase [Tessaracoccus sp. Y1736]